MRFACISDTHGKHDQLIMPTDVDVILHAGDFTGSGHVWETKAFFEWFSKQDAPHKIFISGNHDFMDQDHPVMFKELLKEYPNLTYLRDEGHEINGIKIWGRPWTPEFCEWAFMADPDSPKMLSTLSIVPANLDILLTHGPAYQILDKTVYGEVVGCKNLRDELERIQPKYMIFGHIHESAGKTVVGPTTHINASILNERYQHKNQPIIIEIP